MRRWIWTWIWTSNLKKTMVHLIPFPPHPDLETALALLDPRKTLTRLKESILTRMTEISGFDIQV